MAIQPPLTYLITKGNLTPQNFADASNNTLAIIRSAIDANISLIQIREKRISARLLMELSTRCVNAAAGTLTKILINDRFDIALAAGANGVHLTSDSIPTRFVRDAAPKSFVIGVSTHSIMSAEKARGEGADFVTLSPVFPTISKNQSLPPVGLEALTRACRAVSPFPVIALGGIEAANWRSALDAGACGIAGIGFFNDTHNLETLMSGIRNS